MCLTSNSKLKEKPRFLKKSEACASPQKHKFKNIEFCFIKVSHVPQFERVRSTTMFYNKK